MNVNTPNKVEKLHKPSILEVLGIEKLSETEIEKDIKDIESFHIATTCESDGDSVKTENVLPSSYPVKPRRIHKSTRNLVQDNTCTSLSATAATKSSVMQKNEEKTEYVTFDKKIIEDSYQLIEAVQRTNPEIWKHELQYEALQQQITAYRNSSRQRQLKFTSQKQQQENYFKLFQGLLARAIKLNQVYNKRILILYDIIKNFQNLSTLSSKLLATQTSSDQNPSISNLSDSITECNKSASPTPVVIDLGAPDCQQTQLVYEGQRVSTPYGEGIIRKITVSLEKIDLFLPYGILHTSFGQLMSWSASFEVKLSRLLKPNKLSCTSTTNATIKGVNSQADSIESTSAQSSDHRLGVLDSLSLESTTDRWLSMKPCLNIPWPIKNSVDSILRHHRSACQYLHHPMFNSGSYSGNQVANEVSILDDKLDVDQLSSQQACSSDGNENNGISPPSQSISIDGTESNGICSDSTENPSSTIGVSLVIKKRIRGKSSVPSGPTEPAETQASQVLSVSESSTTDGTKMDTLRHHGSQDSHTALVVTSTEESPCDASTNNMVAEIVDPAHRLHSLSQISARHIPIQDVLLAFLQPDQIRLMLESKISTPAPRLMAAINSISIADLSLFNEFLLSEPLKLKVSGIAGNLPSGSYSKNVAVNSPTGPPPPLEPCKATYRALDPQIQELKTQYHTALRERLCQLRAKLADLKRGQSECWTQVISAQRQCAHAAQLKARASLLRPAAGLTEALINPSNSKSSTEFENAASSEVPKEYPLELNPDHRDPRPSLPNDPPKRRLGPTPQQIQELPKRRRVQLDQGGAIAQTNLEIVPSSSQTLPSSSRQSSRRGSASSSSNTNINANTYASIQSQCLFQDLVPDSAAVAMNGHLVQRNGESRKNGNSSKSHDHCGNGNKEDTISKSKVRRKHGL